uniref:Uncharacterized protein n=1 Tax=Arundo donax TaxID=35708 RepID=A0A0A9C1W2_ARUDO
MRSNSVPSTSIFIIT